MIACPEIDLDPLDGRLDRNGGSVLGLFVGGGDHIQRAREWGFAGGDLLIEGKVDSPLGNHWDWAWLSRRLLNSCTGWRILWGACKGRLRQFNWQWHRFAALGQSAARTNAKNACKRNNASGHKTDPTKSTQTIQAPTPPTVSTT